MPWSTGCLSRRTAVGGKSQTSSHAIFHPGAGGEASKFGHTAVGSAALPVMNLCFPRRSPHSHLRSRALPQATAEVPPSAVPTGHAARLPASPEGSRCCTCTLSTCTDSGALLPPAACPLLPGEPVNGEPRGWWWRRRRAGGAQTQHLLLVANISASEEPRAVPGQGRRLQGAATPRDAKARSGSSSWGGHW